MNKQLLTNRRALTLVVAATAVASSVLLPSCGNRLNPFNGNHRGTTPPSQAGAPAAAAVAPAPCATPPRRDRARLAAEGDVRVAVIGDYGSAGTNEANVADMVRSWSPDAVITTGDNNYPTGGADTIDANIGQYYHQFIGPYAGRYGCGSTDNRFFPALGNHDLYTPGAAPYRAYFTLPGNERYYDVLLGNVHLFAIDSDSSEPDGVTSTGAQAQWLKQRLVSSTARWKVVYMHHPPYSSGPHQSSAEMRWPFKAWGASLVMAGHDHDYERLEIDGFPYLVNGLGGASLYKLGNRIAGSVASFDADFGAALMIAHPTTLTVQFFTVRGQMLDQLVLGTP